MSALVAAMRGAAHALASVALVACGSQPVMSLELEVLAIDDSGNPLRDVAVFARDAPLGDSDAHGRIAGRVMGLPGAVVRLRTRCPDGYAPEGVARRVILPDTATSGPTVRRTQVVCHASRHASALVVRVATGDGIPLAGVEVRVDGELRGHTDSEGSEHILIEREPGSRVTVALDASAIDGIVNPHHLRSTLLGDGEGVVLVDRRFERMRTAPPPRTRRARKLPARERNRPVRIR